MPRSGRRATKRHATRRHVTEGTGRGGVARRLGVATALATAALAGAVLFGATALAQTADAPDREAGAAHERSSANMTVLRTDSSLYAVTHRAGLFGFLGHEHAITAQEWSARLCYLEDDIGASFVAMTVPTASARIDTERGQELADLESTPDADTVEDLQEQMLSPRFLDAAAFPELTFVSTSVAPREESGDAGPVDLTVTGNLSIRGRTVAVTFPVAVERMDTGSFHFDAHVAFRMTDFGIAPENTVGVVAVADEMDLYVSLAAQRTAGTCD